MAPVFIDAEVLSAAGKRVAAGSLDLRVAREAVNVLGRMQLRRIVLDGLLSRMWELKDNMTPYDAAYVALAEALRVPLVTGDRQLARSPRLRCEVRLHS